MIRTPVIFTSTNTNRYLKHDCMNANNSPNGILI